MLLQPRSIIISLPESLFKHFKDGVCVLHLLNDRENSSQLYNRILSVFADIFYLHQSAKDAPLYNFKAAE